MSQDWTLWRSFAAVAESGSLSGAARHLGLSQSTAGRMFRPTQLELISRKLGETPIVACAHESYLARRGVPLSTEDLTSHDLLGFDRSDILIGAAQRMGFTLCRKNFAVRCDNQSVLWQLAQAGLGISFAQRNIVRETPGMIGRETRSDGDGFSETP